MLRPRRPSVDQLNRSGGPDPVAFVRHARVGSRVDRRFRGRWRRLVLPGQHERDRHGDGDDAGPGQRRKRRVLAAVAPPRMAQEIVHRRVTAPLARHPQAPHQPPAAKRAREHPHPAPGSPRAAASTPETPEPLRRAPRRGPPERFCQQDWCTCVNQPGKLKSESSIHPRLRPT
jgi:hypothetical protein